MNDFESIINQNVAKALSKGMDPKALADQMAAAFNDAIKQKEAAEAKAKEAQMKSQRDKVIGTIEKTFWEHAKEEHLTTSDAAALAFLTITTDSEFGRSLQTTEELKDLFNHIVDLLKSVEGSFKFKKEMKNIFGDLADKLDFGGMIKVNKSKDEDGDTEKRKKMCTCGTDRITKPPMSDRDKVMEFLRSL